MAAIRRMRQQPRDDEEERVVQEESSEDEFQEAEEEDQEQEGAGEAIQNVGQPQLEEEELDQGHFPKKGPLVQTEEEKRK